jgi:hypothetical protein
LGKKERKKDGLRQERKKTEKQRKQEKRKNRNKVKGCGKKKYKK